MLQVSYNPNSQVVAVHRPVAEQGNLAKQLTTGSEIYMIYAQTAIRDIIVVSAQVAEGEHAGAVQ